MCHIKIFFGKIFNDKKFTFMGTFGGRFFAVQRRVILHNKDPPNLLDVMFFTVCRPDIIERSLFRKLQFQFIESSHFGASENHHKLENETA